MTIIDGLGEVAEARWKAFVADRIPLFPGALEVGSMI